MIKFDYLLYLVGFVVIGSLIAGVFAMNRIKEDSTPVKPARTVSDNTHGDKYASVPVTICECVKVHESGQFCERYQVSRLTAND